MINYVYVWFANFRLRFLGCLDWNICFHRYFSQYLSLYEVFNVHTVRYTVLCFWPNGDGEIRTLDPLLARQVLSQLSYAPILMGLSGLEPPTSRLSGVRSNRLSYKPISIWQPPAFPYRHQYSIIGRFRLNHRVRDVDGCFPKAYRHQKTASRALALHALEVSSKLPFVINFH